MRPIRLWRDGLLAICSAIFREVNKSPFLEKHCGDFRLREQDTGARAAIDHRDRCFGETFDTLSHRSRRCAAARRHRRNGRCRYCTAPSSATSACAATAPRETTGRHGRVRTGKYAQTRKDLLQVTLR
jgi:hypothetical protein